MLVWFSDARVCASRQKRAGRSVSLATRSGSTLPATSRFSRVSRAIHLAHAACADPRDDFVRTEAGAGGQRHQRPDERLALIVAATFRNGNAQ